jgi:tryptophan-rich sensory protein
VVWTTIYLLIALAAARVSLQRQAGTALALWSVQIALNTLWTPVFLGARRKGAGLIIIVFLWLTVLVMLPVFWSLNPVAGLLIVPYLLWLSVAASLDFWIWRHNPD